MTKPQIDLFLEHPVPLDFITGRICILGTSGAAKTSGARRLAEQIWKAKVRFGVIDLQSDWYGLKSSADGTSEGIPVVIFGGDHADLPLDPSAGAQTAEVVAELEQPFILDLGNWSKTKQIRFVGAFLDRLLEIMPKHPPMALLCDEVDVYAPQKPMSPEANVTLAATSDIAKRGRKRGIFPVFVTQRNSGLNKEVTELCQITLIYRTPGHVDQEVVKHKLGRALAKDKVEELLLDVATLPTGTCVVVSQLPELRMLETLQVKRPETFDSSATPELGKRRREPKVLAKPDLEALRGKLAAAIEKAKADNPAELRKQLAERDRKIRELEAAAAQEQKVTDAALQRAAAATKVETKRVPVLKKGELARLERVLKAFDRVTSQFSRTELYMSEAVGPVYFAIQQVLSASSAAATTSGDVAAAAVRAGVRAPVNGAGSPEQGARTSVGAHTDRPASTSAGVLRNATPSTPARTTRGGSSGLLEERGRSTAEVAGSSPAPRSEGVTPVQQRILDALAEVELIGGAAADREMVAMFSGYTNTTSKGFANAIGALRSAGLIDYPASGVIALTAAGRAIASAPAAPRTSEELQEHVFGLLPPVTRRVLTPLIASYPDALDRTDLAARAGYTNTTSKGFANTLGRLRSLGLITYPSTGQVAAARVLFLDAA